MYTSDHHHLTTFGSNYKYRHSGTRTVQTGKPAKHANQPTNNTTCSTCSIKRPYKQLRNEKQNYY